MVGTPLPSKEPAAVPAVAKEPAPAPTAPTAPPAPRKPLVEVAAKEPAPARAAPQAPPPPAMVTAKAEQASPGSAKLIIAVSPRGELYIDGKHHGTTPPVTTLDLEPGLHRIEIRSGSRKPYLTYMTIEAGDERRIRHDFNARPSAPPR